MALKCGILSLSLGILAQVASGACVDLSGVYTLPSNSQEMSQVCQTKNSFALHPDLFLPQFRDNQRYMTYKSITKGSQLTQLIIQQQGCDLIRLSVKAVQANGSMQQIFTEEYRIGKKNRFSSSSFKPSWNHFRHNVLTLHHKDNGGFQPLLSYPYLITGFYWKRSSHLYWRMDKLQPGKLHFVIEGSTTNSNKEKLYSTCLLPSQS